MTASSCRDGARLDALTAQLIARFGRERAGVYSLDRMRRLMLRLGSPQESYQVVHVAGTSGKTSTCYAVRDLLEGAGVRTGLTISPHISHLDERAQVGGLPLDTDRFVAHIDTLLGRLDGWNETPSFFELMAAAAFWIFAREGVQVAVVEVGLGGRLDATNVIDRPDKVCAIAAIGLDHTEVLGSNITQIAQEKGGIVQPGNRVLVQDQGAEILDELRQRAARACSFDVVEPCTDLPATLGYQRANVALAAAAYKALSNEHGLRPLDHDDLARAASATPPGRFERVALGRRAVLLDTAHNPQKLAALRERAAIALPRPFAVCVAFSQAPDHKVDEMVAELAQFDPMVLIATEYAQGALPTGKHPVAAGRIATSAAALGIDVLVQPDPELALRSVLRPETTAIVTGSTFLVAQFRARLLAQVGPSPICPPGTSTGPSGADERAGLLHE